MPDLDPTKATYAPEWIPRATPLKTTAGMHRFVWPLRYAKPAALASADTDIDGVWAPPGQYTVELVVDGKRMRQPLTVMPDPRVKLADEAYAQQFALARDIETAQLRLAKAQTEAKTLHKALVSARAASSDNPELNAAIAALDADVIAQSGIVDAGNPHNAWALPPTTTTSLRFVGETFEKLATAADGADAAPTPDARAGYAATTALLDKALKDWAMLTLTKLGALNAQLKAAHRDAISAEEPASKRR